MPVPRIHVEQPLAPGADIALGANATRHVQVLRLQPGDAVTLFDGSGGEWAGEIGAITRREVRVRPLRFDAVERELPRSVTLALGMPANERMDALIEKATELGTACIQPLVCERSVLRVAGERAQRKAAHWRAVAVAACEQCGRNRVPEIAEPLGLAQWLRAQTDAAVQRLLLSGGAAARWPPPRSTAGAVIVLSGPEGGLTSAEETDATAAGFVAYSLGPRVLRADTAPLGALAWLALELP
jgi:16S rRNA (uracil1498-N3)-methyltransferase